MRFDLIDLRLFLNVHETGTITDGARRSYMTLASASERIKGMEAILGVALLTRDYRGVAVTPAGRTLIHHARVVLEQMDRMRGELQYYGQGIKGHVRLLCNTSALSEYLPEILSQFLASHPHISIDIEERLSYEITDALRNGMADLGVVASSADLQGLETFTFRADPLTLICAREHELALRRSIRLEDVAHLDFVGLIAGSALQEHVAHHARKAGKSISYRVRLRSFDAVCRMVGLGIGIGIVPKATAVRCARSARIRHVALLDEWANRDLVLCVRTTEGLPGYVRQMLRHILSSTPVQ
jgi:DNA-binding transcriptional LysR family regulator